MSTKTYRIRPGFSFRGDDGGLLGPGDQLELADDAAELHAGKLDLVEPTPAVQTSAPAADPHDAGAHA